MNKLMQSAKAAFVQMFLLAALLVVGATQSSAQTVFELDQTYSVAAYGSLEGTFTAPEDGQLVATLTGGLAGQSRMSAEGEETWLWTYENASYSGSTCTYRNAVTKGVAYHIVLDNFWGPDGTMKLEFISGVVPVTVEEYFPAGNQKFNCNDLGGMVNLVFSEPILLDEATAVIVNDKGETASIEPNVQGKYVSADVIKPLIQQMKNGWTTGENFKVRFTNVRAVADQSRLFNGDGIVELPYLVPDPLVMVQSVRLPEKMLPYWEPGDPDALVQITFTDNVYKSGTSYAMLDFGDPTYESMYYREMLDFTVEGNVVTIDLSGKNRVPVELVSMLDDFIGFNLSVSALLDDNDNYIYSGVSSSPHTVSYLLPYDEDMVIVASDWYPTPGTLIQKGQTVELYLNNVYALRNHKGMKYTLSDEEFVIDPDAVYELDGEGGCTLTSVVPDAVFELSRGSVIVSINEPEWADGRTRSKIAATYYTSLQEDDLIILQPTSTVLPGLNPDDVVEVRVKETLDSEVNFVGYTITDKETGDYLKFGYLARDEESGTWKNEVYEKLKFLKDHVYIMHVQALTNEYDGEEVCTAEMEITGTTEPYIYSTAEFVSITPDNWGEINEMSERTFTMEFTEPVVIDKQMSGRLLGQGMGIDPFAEFLNAEGNSDTPSTTWMLSFSEAQYQSMGTAQGLEIVVYVKDANGLIPHGNTFDEDEQSHFYFEYGFYANTEELVLSPAESESPLTSLAVFTVTSPAGVENSWMGDPITLESQSTGQIWDAQIVDNTIIISEFSYDTWLYTPVVVTDPGTYVLTIPAKNFIWGEDMMTTMNKKQTFVYTIDDGVGINSVLEPNTQHGIFTLDGKKVAEPKRGIYIIDGKKVVKQ